MKKIAISSLQHDDKLIIEYRPSNDVVFGTMDQFGACDAAIARMGVASKYSTVRSGRHIQTLLGMMANNFEDIVLQQQDLMLTPETRLNVYSFSSDNPDVFVSMLEGPDSLIGIQTWHKDWQNYRQSIEPVWLGHALERNNQEKIIRLFYAECAFNILRSWEGGVGAGKWAQKQRITLEQAMHPKLNFAA